MCVSDDIPQIYINFIKYQLLIDIDDTIFLIYFIFIIFLSFSYFFSSNFLPVQYLPSPETTNPGGHSHVKLPS